MNREDGAQLLLRFAFPVLGAVKSPEDRYRIHQDKRHLEYAKTLVSGSFVFTEVEGNFIPGIIKQINTSKDDVVEFKKTFEMQLLFQGAKTEVSI